MTAEFTRKPLIAGNWKMHKTIREAVELAGALRAGLDGVDGADIVLCPPFTALQAVGGALAGSDTLSLGAQNLYWEPQGAYTGEVSAAMLTDLGCRYVIIGHSERRQYFGETDETVPRKVRAALDAGLVPIVCVGERWEEREAGRTESLVRRQVTAALAGLAPQEVAGLAVAYEPVWAIGTGRAATGADAAEVAALIRHVAAGSAGDAAERLRILYGGSVTSANMGEFMAQPGIDGALVGGASLKADSFAGIVEAALAVRALSGGF